MTLMLAGRRLAGLCPNAVSVAPWSTVGKRAGDVLCLGGWRGVVSGGRETEATVEADNAAFSAAMPFDSIPTPGGLASLPYVGVRFLFKPFTPCTEVGEAIGALHDRLGPVIRVRMMRQWMVFVDRIDDAEVVLRAEGSLPYRRPIPLLEVYNQRSNCPIHTLGVRNGEEWRRLRSAMNVRMNRPQSPLHYLENQEAVARDFADRLFYKQNSTPAELTDLFFRFAAESVGMMAFNQRLGFIEDDSAIDEKTKKLLSSYKNVIQSSAETAMGKRMLYIYYEDSFYRNFKEALLFTRAFTTQRINEVLEEVKTKQREGTFDPDEPNFLLSLLAEPNLTEAEAREVVSALMTAGSDSTACGLLMLFYVLATNKDKQQKLADEVLSHMGPDGPLTAAILDKMIYLKATVRESLRLYFPLSFGVRRILPYDVVIGGYQVPKGTSAIVHSNRIANSELYFDEPDKFMPERWIRGEGGNRVTDISTMAYLPFGFGLRGCVGRRVALQEIYLAASKVLQKYEIGLKDDAPPLECTFFPFRMPKYDMPFTFTPRL